MGKAKATIIRSLAEEDYTIDASASHSVSEEQLLEVQKITQELKTQI